MMTIFTLMVVFSMLSLLSLSNGKHISKDIDDNDRFEEIIAGGIILNENVEDENSEETLLIFAANKEGDDDDTEHESKGNGDIALGILIFSTGNKMDVEPDTEDAEHEEYAKKQNIEAIERLFQNKSTKKRHHERKSHAHDKVNHHSHKLSLSSTIY